eukprot:c44172_g1_i1 orf=17-262(-)
MYLVLLQPLEASAMLRFTAEPATVYVLRSSLSAMSAQSVLLRLSLFLVAALLFYFHLNSLAKLELTALSSLFSKLIILCYT